MLVTIYDARPRLEEVLLSVSAVPAQLDILREISRSAGLGFRVQGSGFRVQGSEFRVQGSGFRVQGSGFRDQGSGFRGQGSGFRVRVSGLETNRVWTLPSTFSRVENVFQST